jgi:beta-N-acetylglucosaminidase
MSQKLLALINNDLSKGITPVWHDESALNWYLLNKNPLMASTQYASPEGWGIQNVKIMNRDKNKFGGYNYLRTAK